MSETQYNVRALLSAFNEIVVPQKILDCEINFELLSKRYFISTTVNAQNEDEAQSKAMPRIDLVLGMFQVYLGVHFEIEAIDRIQLFEPFLSSRRIILTRLNLRPVPQNDIAEVKRLIELFDGLPNSENKSRAEKAITFLRKGCFMEQNRWKADKAESFLNYFKAIELISHNFRGIFDNEVGKSIHQMDLGDLTDEELKILRTPKRLIQFTVKHLGITDNYDIPKIVVLRNQFGAHANLKDIEVSNAEFNNCKSLSITVLFKYLEYLRTK